MGVDFRRSWKEKCSRGIEVRCVLTDVSHSKESVHLAGSHINHLLGFSIVFVFIIHLQL